MRHGYHQRTHIRKSPKGKHFAAGRMPFEVWLKRKKDSLMNAWYMYREASGSNITFDAFAKRTYSSPGLKGYEISGFDTSAFAEYYVRAKSKKAVNEMLAAGEEVYAIKYEMFNQDSIRLQDLPKGTVLRIFEKYVGDQPYAKAYGTWDGVKVK